jgi:hypothetical protein
MNYGDRPLELPPQEGGTPETERSIRAITEVGLPVLVGTPEDVDAAAVVRLDKLRAADDLLTELRVSEREGEVAHAVSVSSSPAVSVAEVQRAQEALNHLRHQQDAAWWLANRDRTARELLDAFAGGMLLP